MKEAVSKSKKQSLLPRNQSDASIVVVTVIHRGIAT
jgi:hypothetical protein